MIEKCTNDNLLSNNNLAHIDNKTNIDTKAKFNLNKDITDSNLYKKNSKMNIEELFQQVRDQTICKRLTKKVLEQTCRFF